MEPIISKEEQSELRKIKGETRGMTIRSFLEYILKRKGKEGLKKIEKVMESIDGCAIKYETLKETLFYPLRCEVSLFLIIKKIFNFTDENIREMGASTIKHSFIVRMFVKYFSSIRLAAKDPLKMFNKYYTTGSLAITELNEEKKYVIVKIKDFKHHPDYCRALEGFFSTIIKMITKTKGKTTCRELKCPFKGDEYHEFLVKW